MHPNSPTQENTDPNEKSGQAVAKQTPVLRVAKSHPDYWRTKLFRPAYTRDGKKFTVPEWAIRIQYKGRRETFSFGTANQAKAAGAARDVFACLVANGWDTTLATYKPETAKQAKAPTVGEFLKAAKAVATIAPGTYSTYAGKLRSIVAGVLGIEVQPVERTVVNPETGKPMISRKTGQPRTKLVDPRFDYVNGGSEQWRAKIESVSLDRLTPEKVQKWCTSRLEAAAAESPAKAKAARTTLNSMLRGGSSLFASAITRHLGHLRLPSPLPFEGVTKPTAPRVRYVSKITPQILHTKAVAELLQAEGPDSADYREMYAIYLLALFAGLRRDEIDSLSWSQFNWDDGSVSVETNQHTAAKCDESHGTVRLSADVLSYFQTKFQSRKSAFVIESPVKPRPTVTTYHHYRCQRLFKKLIGWLRSSAGVTTQNPVHTLRKEFGSAIARDFGIYAASEALRHADIRLTQGTYLAPDKRATFSPASLMKAQPVEDHTQTAAG